MTIALFLIPYTLFLIVWTFLSIFALYHIVEFGEKNFTTFLATFLYIAAAVILLFVSFTTLAQIHWTTPILTNFAIQFVP